MERGAWSYLGVSGFRGSGVEGLGFKGSGV